MCYPLSAFLLLFNATLDGQRSANAQANLAAIAAFVGFLERVRATGCDVTRLLMLCAKLHQVSSMMIDSDLLPENMHCIKVGRSARNLAEASQCLVSYVRFSNLKADYSRKN